VEASSIERGRTFYIWATVTAVVRSCPIPAASSDICPLSAANCAAESSHHPIP
jgi:hypothetical protein